jgi:hypothetical protein
MARKRGQNEGSIYQRKDGLWTVAVTVQGKRISLNAGNGLGTHRVRSRMA